MLLSGLVACGGGGGDGSGGGGPLTIFQLPVFLDLADCLVDSLEDTDGVLDELIDTLAQATYDPMTGEFQFNVGPLTVQGVVEGAGGADLSDGFQIGETANVSAQLSGSQNGQVNLAVTRTSAILLEIGGVVTATNAGGCLVQLDQIDFEVDPTQPDRDYSGSLVYGVSDTDSLTGTITYAAGSNAAVTASLNGGDTVSFSLDVSNFSFLFN